MKIEHKELIEQLNKMNADEIIEISNKIGYPVFTRLCLEPSIQHKFVLLQDGAAAIIVDEDGKILLQSRADRDKWGLPGGCQELGETFEQTVIREIYEETNLVVKEQDLKLISVVSGPTRRNDYPNGDIVINNTILYCIKKYNGTLKWDNESKDMKFFSLDNLPTNQHDPDLVEAYVEFLSKSK